MKIKKFISQLKSVLISKDNQGDMEKRVFSRCINSMVAGFAVSIVLYFAYQFHFTDLFGSTNAFSGSDISKITILALVVPASFVIYLLISLVTRMGIIPMLVTLIALPIPLRIIISLIHLNFSYNSNQLFSDINFGMFHSALIYATLHALLILIILRRQREAI